MQNNLGRGFFMEPHIATVHGNRQEIRKPFAKLWQNELTTTCNNLPRAVG